MFTIKKLTLNGFKSFSDYTEINLSNKGITAIIGPNGCGKSNIADAISWVIGEQRARLLRGSKMMDVISQGSKYRAPASFAEIMLELKLNSDNSIILSDGISLNANQSIDIRRRLYRDGNSEYLINKKPCRLRDIQTLLSGTGLGTNHYAIIEQGRVGQILSAKPQDQRLLLEEAAEISGFRQKQHNAQLKLDSSKQNLLRLLDIIDEIEKQEASLKRQASKSKKYRELQGKLRHCLNYYYLRTFHLNLQSLSSYTFLLKELKEKEASLTIKLQETQEFLGDLERNRYQTEGEVEKLRSDLTENKVQVERSTQLQSQASQQSLSLHQRLKELSNESSPVSDRVELVKKEHLLTHEAYKSIESKITDEGNNLSSEEKELQSNIINDQELEKEVSELRAKHYNLSNQIERYKYLEKQHEDSIQHYIKRQQTLIIEKERTSNSLLSTNTSANSTSFQLQQLNNQINNLQTEQIKTVTQSKEAASAQTNLQKAIADSTEKLNSLSLRLSFLNQVNKKREYFFHSVQELLSSNNRFALAGTLSDCISTTPDIEHILETAFYSELQYLIATPLTNIKEAIEYLNAQEIGTASFLLPDSTQISVTNKKLELNPGSLLLHLNLPQEIQQSVQTCIPQLAYAEICTNLKEAIKLSAKYPERVFVTKNGEKAVAGQLIISRSQANKKFRILSLKREAQQLTQQAEDLSKKLNYLTASLPPVEQNYSGLIQKQKEIESDINQVQQNIVVTEQQAKFLEQEHHRVTSHLNLIDHELQQIQAEVIEASKKFAQTQTEKSGTENLLESIISELAEAELKLAQFRQLSEQKKSAISARRSEFAAMLEKRRGIQSELRRIETELDTLNNRLISIENNQTEINAQIIKNSNTQESLNQDLLELKQSHNSTQQKLDEQLHKLDKIKQQAGTLQEDLKTTRLEYDNTRESRTQTEIELARTESQIEHLKKMYEAELGEDLAAKAAEAQPENEPEAAVEPEEAERQINDLRKNIQNLGTVNLAALEELDEVTERLSFLYTQRVDIEKAITETQTSIAEIKKHTKDKFLNAFNIINANFTETFKTLFGGGHAEIRLIDSEDILESGVEIIAQPPGKRLQNILLLSGGEKAMSALALIIAIFKFKPSPFCLLDEVDAPLDDANIGKLANIITEMSKETQFLVITHSKRTMEAANTIYGVTMETPGISSVVSVQLS